MSPATCPWPHENLSARIAQLRKSADITQVQLAEFLGVSQQTVNAYEMGHRRMAISALPRIFASAFSMSFHC